MTTAALRKPSVAAPPADRDFAEEFLTLVAQAIVDKMDDSLISDFSVEATSELAQNIWTRWDRYTDLAQKRSCLEAVARFSFEEMDAVIERVEKAFGASANSDLGKMLGNYLNLLPGNIRRRCKRPGQPAGTKVPDGMPLNSGEDLLPLLPARMTRFQPGDRPWSVGEYELVELIEQGAYREVWKARSLTDDAAPPVALHFILHSAARSFVQKAGAATLKQVLQLGAAPGLVPLQAIHDHADPPCLQYAHVEAADVTALVQEWRETGRTPDPWHVADLIQQLGRIVGQLHRRAPAFVHRHLSPQHILVAARAAGGWQCRLANLGLGPWSNQCVLEKAVQSPYSSPEQSRDDAPEPRDDVFALGVLWYQLLVCDLERPRPGGSSWRRRLTRQDVPPEFIELLESCFDDDPGERPADAFALAERILNITPRSERPSHNGSGRPTPLVLNTLGMAFVPVSAGTFRMGSDPAETGRGAQEFLRHEVTLDAPFHLSVTTVTQGQYECVVGKSPAHFTAARGGGPDHPAEMVSWDDAEAFCRKLSELPEEKQAGRVYRLPTETEWEYACRGGTNTAYIYGDALTSSQACYGAQAPTRVGSFAPNALGLYDMHGNVWEWCADVSPGNPAGALRVLRGGSWHTAASACRSAARHALPATFRAADVGFRVVMEQTSEV